MISNKSFSSAFKTLKNNLRKSHYSLTFKEINSKFPFNPCSSINNKSLQSNIQFFSNYSLSHNFKITNLIINSYTKKNFTTTTTNKMDASTLKGKNYFEIKRQNKDIILTPKEGHDTALIFMHGLGDSAEGYLSLFLEDYRPIPNRMKVVLLTAPTALVTINGGAVMNSWYDILSFKREKGSISEDDVVKNSVRIRNAISNEAKALNGNFGKVFVGGFSQGCCMALYAALTLKENVGGVIGLSGLLFPFVEFSGEEENDKKKDLPILLSHGKWDSVIPYQIAEESYQRLKDARFNFKFHAFDDEHTIDYSTMEEVKNFLTKLV